MPRPVEAEAWTGVGVRLVAGWRCGRRSRNGDAPRARGGHRVSSDADGGVQGRPTAGPSRREQVGEVARPSKNRVREQVKAEQAVEQAEAALRELEDELADPAAWATKYEAAKSEARHTAAKRAVEQAYERLEALVD